ncbi:MAG: hypothetical protein ACREHC_03865 [Candidatus Levyibacteriota bacterium]
MNRRHGVILLDEGEIIFRIYETSDQEWKLFHYHSALIHGDKVIDTSEILEVIGNFFTTDYAQHIADWKICSRQFSEKIINDISSALAISVENLSIHREQELLCKGMFTELW